MRALRSDRGGGYYFKEFQEFCEDIAVERQFIVVHTPQQNGLGKNKKIMEMIKLMINEEKTSKMYFGVNECTLPSIWLINALE